MTYSRTNREWRLPKNVSIKANCGSGKYFMEQLRLTPLAAAQYTGPRQRMLLAREFIDYLSRQLVRKLSPNFLETAEPQRASEIVADVIHDELEVEDLLNDEVREILSQYSEYMRKEGVSYQDMFRRIKNTLVSQRKVIRASGRDTGDQMKLSRDKINDI